MAQHITSFTYEQERRFFAALGIEHSPGTALSGSDIVEAVERQAREFEAARDQVRELEASSRRLETESSELKDLRRDLALERGRERIAAEDATSEQAERLRIAEAQKIRPEEVI